MTTETITTIDQKPTADMPEGLYRVVINGIYYNTYRVTSNLFSGKFVMDWNY